MKTLIAIFIFAVGLFLSFGVQAEKPTEKGMHDMHVMIRMMNQGLCNALEGANLQMLGQMGMSEKLDKDTISRGMQMVKDGKALIKNTLEGEAMKKLYKEGSYEHETMDELHKLGQNMLQVIEQAEKLNERIHKPGFKYEH